MQCGICCELFDIKDRKPYALIPCVHTLCNSCISKLRKKTCPNCKNDFYNTTPNWILLELLQEKSNEKLKSECANFIDDCIDLKNTINQYCDSKLKEIDIKYKTVENEITNQTNSLIKSIELNHSKLLAKLDIMRLQELNDINKYIIDKSKDNDEVNAKKFLSYNLNETQLSQLRVDFSEKNRNLKIKLNEMRCLNENKIEFSFNKNNTNLDLGSIKIYSSKHKSKNDDKSSKSYMEKAKQHEEASDLKSALVCYEKAIELDKNNHKAYFLKGKIHEKLEDWRSASKCYKNAFRIEPYNSLYMNYAKMIMNKK